MGSLEQCRIFLYFKGKIFVKFVFADIRKKLNTSIAQKDDIQSVYTDTEAAFTN